jgi:hypothetical protein
VCIGEYCALGRHDPVTGQSQLQAAGDGWAVHRGEKWFRELPDRAQHRAHATPVGRRIAVRMHVQAGAKGWIRAGEDTDDEVGVARELPESVSKSLGELRVERITRRGSIEGEEEDAVVALDSQTSHQKIP